MLSSSQLQQLQQIAQQLNAQQRAWVSGFFAGLQQLPAAEPGVEAPAVTILYATQSGNAKSIATEFGEQLQQAGFAPKITAVEHYKSAQLKRENILLVITSTHGEGDPPDSAQKFYDFIHSERAPSLSHLRYSVLALGDSSYEEFCKTGTDFDSQFEKLGAVRIADISLCDVDYDPTRRRLEKIDHHRAAFADATGACGDRAAGRRRIERARRVV